MSGLAVPRQCWGGRGSLLMAEEVMCRELSAGEGIDGVTHHGALASSGGTPIALNLIPEIFHLLC